MNSVDSERVRGVGNIRKTETLLIVSRQNQITVPPPGGFGPVALTPGAAAAGRLVGI